MIRRIGSLVIAALCVVSLAAQSGAVVEYRLDVFDAAVDAYATGDPLAGKHGSLPASAVTCNQVPPTLTTLTVANPRRVFWTDPVNVGKVCVASTTVAIWFTPDEAVGRTFVLTITPVDDRGLVGPRSGASPPFMITAPSAISGVRVVP